MIELSDKKGGLHNEKKKFIIYLQFYTIKKLLILIKTTIKNLSRTYVCLIILIGNFEHVFLREVFFLEVPSNMEETIQEIVKELESESDSFVNMILKIIKIYKKKKLF